MKQETPEDIIENIYIFGVSKTIPTDQGQNFISDMMQQFEETLKIKHIKTTSVHPQ